MKFPNAFSGVKKIFTSEILSIIGAAAMLIAAIASLITLGAANDASGAIAGLGISAILLVAGGIVALIAYILLIVGVSKAMKDEPAFKVSLIFIIVAAVSTIVVSFVGDTTAFGSILKIVTDVANLCVTLFIIQGIRNLADKMNNGEVSAKGQKIFMLITCIYVIILIAQIVALFSAAIAGVIAIIAYVLSIIQYIVFLTYLAQAKKMLAE